jgi:hypothetical protein
MAEDIYSGLSRRVGDEHLRKRPARQVDLAEIAAPQFCRWLA